MNNEVEKSMSGKFITFEGCEGAGKSRQIQLLSEYLTQNGIEHIVTREPGGNRISESIRSIILDGANTAMADECEALLYAAARVQVLKEIIAPALKSGKIVICDRYVDSSFAYQGYARGLGVETIESINFYAVKNFMPNLTVFLDIPPKEAFERKHGADKGDRLEQAGMAFHDKVYRGYKEIAKRYPDRFIPINPMGEKQETHQKILRLLKERGII